MTYILSELLRNAPKDDHFERKRKALMDVWNTNKFVTTENTDAEGNKLYTNPESILTHFPLQMSGVEQAFKAAQRHWDSGICNEDKMPVIWASPMMRTLQTARVIKFALEVWSGKDIDLKVVPELMEESTNMEGVTYGDLVMNKKEGMELNMAAGLKTNTKWPLTKDDELHKHLKKYYGDMMSKYYGREIVMILHLMLSNLNIWPTDFRERIFSALLKATRTQRK